ncbi:PIN domain-containing protein [Desulfococcaceae bacterium HSG8]|nr:PIN domain-containing protein [Desulfococcaceae bacterium HSG8]
MSGKRVFIDTNIWIYGLVESNDPSEKEKRIVSLSLFESLLSESEIVVSTQILNECHWNLIRKFGYGDSEVYMRIQENIIAISNIMNVNQRTYHNSFQIREKYHLSFWDSLVIASALEGECLEIYTEDMQHGQKLDDLLIINPFMRG